MPLNFPNSPTLNDVYSFGGKSWIWNGDAWQLRDPGAINGVVIGNTTAASGAFTTLTSSANTVLGDIAGNLVPAANITYNLGNATRQWNELYLSGNTIFLGGAQITANATAITLIGPEGAEFPVTGNSAANTDGAFGSITATGNITGNFFIGNGSQLTGVAVDTETTTVSSTAPENPSQGDVWINSDTGRQYIYFNDGDSNQWADLTAVNSFSTDSYNDANVASYLPTYTGNLPALTGNVITTANVSAGNLLATLNVAATGNVTGGNLVTAGEVTTVTVDASGNVTGGNVSTAGLITATGNVTAGNLVTSGTVDAATMTASNTISATGNITGGNLTTTGDVTTATVNATGNVTGGNISTAGVVTVSGNITGGNLVTAGDVTTATVTASGNVSGGNLVTAGDVTTATVTASGNVSGGNLTTAGDVTTATVTASGNVSGGNLTTSGAVTGNGRALTSLNASNLDTGTVPSAQLSGTYTITVSGSATTAGTVTTAAQPNITSVGTLTSLSVTGNVSGGNLTTAGRVDATGNVSGGNLVAAADVTTVRVIASGNITATANVSGNNVAAANLVSANDGLFTNDVKVDSLGVGTFASGTSGEIRATNDITAFYSSDQRLKENIREIDHALDKVKQLSGVYFDWRDEFLQERGGIDGYFVRREDTGVIAQQVAAVFPEVVGERQDGYLAIKYDRFAGLLIQAIKELADQVEQIKKRMD